FNDLGFISHIKNDVKGFRVYVAGGMGSKPQVGNLLHDFIPAEQVYPVARAIKVIFSRYGNRKNKHAARLRFLWNKLGREKFIQLYSDEYEKIQKTHPAPLQIIEIENKPEPDILLEPVREQTSEFEIWKKRYVKGQKQPGLYSILLPVFLGNISNKDTVILADFLSHFGENVLRCTLEQNFSIRNIPEDYLGNVYRIARDISRLSSGPRFMANSIACAGADTCTLGICRSRGALRAVDRKLEKSGIDLDALSNFKLNISGCPNSCGAHSEADLGFFGKSSRKKEVMYPAYVIVAGAVAENGASRLARKIAQVSARDLPDFLLEALAAYLDKKGRYPSFAAYIDDCGESDIRNICRKYTDIPDFEDDKNYYFDWGAGEIFSLVGIGAGECSAGLFDLIDVDRENIKNQQKSLQTLSDAREISEALYQITLSASRMLLITRGVEVKTEKEVFDAFIAKFIMESLVDKKFTRLVQLARNKDDAQLNGLADQIHELADVTEKLYESMDDSLQFQTEKEKMDSGGLPAYQNAEVNRDYRGIACPMNFVKMKLDLSRMSSGQTLRVLLDDGKPIENVPGSLSGEGHELVFQEKIDDYWAVLIKKA
ncbi:MAG: sulfurtransferase TusA family protein, partial [Desulfobacterales bacterium]|nr:sulfurtransferase TusA family protein [Desulfobacterales bacterium]